MSCGHRVGTRTQTVQEPRLPPGRVPSVSGAALRHCVRCADPLERGDRSHQHSALPGHGILYVLSTMGEADVHRMDQCTTVLLKYTLQESEEVGASVLT